MKSGKCYKRNGNNWISWNSGKGFITAIIAVIIDATIAINWIGIIVIWNIWQSQRQYKQN